MSIQHYIFGYGSLICPVSRSITVPDLAHATVTPVLVRNVERTWAKRGVKGMTAMGVRFMDEAECVGILLPVDEDQLAEFDKREKGYDRVPLYLGDVEPVPFLDETHYEDEDHSVFLEAKEKPEKRGNVKVWMYMQQKLSPPSDGAPIAQSYVDTILRGCLNISEDFAEQFIAHTKGWTPNEILDEDDDEDDEDYNGNSTDSDASMSEENSMDGDSSTNSSSISEDDVYWVNDRHNPIYSRGDQQYMLKNGNKLDSLLKRHRDEFQFRSRHVNTIYQAKD